jgi:hypothetical protein
LASRSIRAFALGRERPAVGTNRVNVHGRGASVGRSLSQYTTMCEARGVVSVLCSPRARRIWALAAQGAIALLRRCKGGRRNAFSLIALRRWRASFPERRRNARCGSIFRRF